MKIYTLAGQSANALPPPSVPAFKSSMGVKFMVRIAPHEQSAHLRGGGLLLLGPPLPKVESRTKMIFSL